MCRIWALALGRGHFPSCERVSPVESESVVGEAEIVTRVCQCRPAEPNATPTHPAALIASSTLKSLVNLRLFQHTRALVLGPDHRQQQREEIKRK